LFVEDLTPTLTVVAEEAKIQVVFDEDVVARYRLIGYENRSLDDDRFTDDTVDAGELGAGHQVSAVYEVELVAGAEASDAAAAGEVRLRWRSTESGEVAELRQPLVVDADADSSPTLRFAALVAHTAEVLRGNSAVTERGLTLDQLLAEAEALAAAHVDGAAELVELLTTAIHAEDPVAGTDPPE
jgi:Ca-activated chloride channel family protein